MIKQNPTVSVIIPCYNQGQYLDEAVESVLAQTYQDFEIIIINDGSTAPETREILKNYSKPKTIIIHIDNQGIVAARNTAIQASQGKYILPLDADDKIGSTYLERAVQLLENNDNLGIVYCEAEFFGNQREKWELPEYKFPNILLGNVIFCSGFFRKSDWQKIGGYNSNMIDAWEDYDFWLSIIDLGREVYRIPEILFYYRRKLLSRNETLNRNKFISSYAKIFNNHKRLYTQNISAIFTEIVDLRNQLECAKGRIKQLEKHEKELESELRKTQNDWQQAVTDWQQAVTTIAAMESSKFWKMRRAWLKIKKLLGLTPL
jgi:glycosyltransferase involved in cell wall biosynthesis